jgi:metallo-beta-lactamase family protein
MTQITFQGAAETVTGSKYLLEADGARVLVDCGLFQGRKDLRERNWHRLPFPPKSVQAVVLTHAHIDHVGYVPRFVKDGFNGPIYATPATEELAELLLLDSAKNQEEDADYANRKGFSKHKPALPLYNPYDVKRALRKFRSVQREEWFQAAGPIWMRYHDAGHLLGSSMIECEVRVSQRTTRILFSGDVGRYDAPLYYDPKAPPTCDYLICESTYGDRDHPPGNVIDSLERVVRDAIARGGVMVVASFAVGRAQQLIYLLSLLIREHRIPELPIYLDSPMAVSGMKIYQYFAAEHDLTDSLNCSHAEAFDMKNVFLTRSSEESKRINGERGPAVIISSSGMMIGGRILHHLKTRLPDPRNTVVISGFQAEGTRGRALQDGARSVRIHGQEIPVRANVVEMSELSGHADRTELLRWLGPLAAPRKVFLTHGELPSANAFAAKLRDELGWHCVVPRMGETCELDA